uniref:Uncharacterized protein n=1 Tax=Odontella aurita TaxID=265563 RepID=A0A7S4JAZ6_9STRA|mmetsp:Transcript_42793/g.130136  ORF Transcript_42793/g.130136 Transcript_42793/m.130136 type:complete len:847 (+) Transcript_42793:137-2677(+)
MVTKVLRSASFKSMRSKKSRRGGTSSDGDGGSIGTSGSSKKSGKEKRNMWRRSRSGDSNKREGGGSSATAACERRGPDGDDGSADPNDDGPDDSDTEEKRDLAEEEEAAVAEEAVAVAAASPSSSPSSNDPSSPSHAPNDDDSADEDEFVEVDYDSPRGPTRLYSLIESRKWKKASVRANTFPSEASVWVRRYEQSDGGGGSVATGFYSKGSLRSYSRRDDSRISSSQSRSSSSKRTRWRLLPLHAAILFDAPAHVIEALLEVLPSAARSRDDKGYLPLHLACRNDKKRSDSSDVADVVKALLEAYPEGAFEEDEKGRTPLVLADRSRRRVENDGVGGEAEDQNDALSALEDFLRGEEAKEGEGNEQCQDRAGASEGGAGSSGDGGAGGSSSGGWFFGGFSLFDAFKSESLWDVQEEEQEEGEGGELVAALSSRGTFDSNMLDEALSASNSGSAGVQGDSVGGGSLRSVESHSSAEDEDDGRDCIVSLGVSRGGGSSSESGINASVSISFSETSGSGSGADGSVGSSFFLGSSNGSEEESTLGDDDSFALSKHNLSIDECDVAVDVMSTITDAPTVLHEDDDYTERGAIAAANANWDETSVMAEILLGSPLVPILDENLLDPDEGVQNVIDDINAPHRCVKGGGGGKRKKKGGIGGKRGATQAKESRRRRDRAIGFLGRAVRLGTASDRVRLVASRGLISSLCGVLTEAGDQDKDAATTSTIAQRQQTIGVLMQLSDLPLLRFRELRPALERGAVQSSDEGLRKAGNLLLLFLSKHEKRGYDSMDVAAGAAVMMDPEERGGVDDAEEEDLAEGRGGGRGSGHIVDTSDSEESDDGSGDDGGSGEDE